MMGSEKMCSSHEMILNQTKCLKIYFPSLSFFFSFFFFTFQLLPTVSIWKRSFSSCAVYWTYLWKWILENDMCFILSASMVLNVKWRYAAWTAQNLPWGNLSTSQLCGWVMAGFPETADRSHSSIFIFHIHSCFTVEEWLAYISCHIHLPTYFKFHTAQVTLTPLSPNPKKVKFNDCFTLMYSVTVYAVWVSKWLDDNNKKF